MTKIEFLKRWCKKATGGGAAEAFEVDVERLSCSIVRSSTSAVVNGIMAGVVKLPKKERDLFRKLIAEVAPAVEKALEKLYQ
jgi:hypothetical protein